jgi:hypothetical protein
MRTVFQAAMQADATLSGLLTGGVHTTNEISRQDTPDAFDANGEIQPCALVKISSESAFGPRSIGGRQLINVYLYERQGTTNIDAALNALRPLFHNTKVGAASDKAWWSTWANEVRDQRDDALDCDMAMVQFQVARFRG